MIKTKRDPFHFYLVLIVVIPLYCLLTMFVFYMMFQQGSATLVYFSLGMIMILFALYSFNQLLKNAPIISIDNGVISFGKKSFPLSEIEQVVLSGKMPYRYIINHPMEGACVRFKDGTEKYIFDDVYTNVWQVKLFLDQKVIKGKEYTPFSQLYEAVEYPSCLRQIKEFKGSQFLSWDGITLWGMMAIFLSLSFLKREDSTPSFWVVIVIMSLFWFFFNSWRMHFFKLTEECLVVSNHNFFWKNDTYRLADIKEVVFETRTNMPHCLRVITKEYKNKLYPASTLRIRHWNRFAQCLKKKKITVRDERLD